MKKQHACFSGGRRGYSDGFGGAGGSRRRVNATLTTSAMSPVLTAYYNYHKEQILPTIFVAAAATWRYAERPTLAVAAAAAAAVHCTG